jgi:hypothetical protein
MRREGDFDGDLRRTAFRVRELSRRAYIDPARKAALREYLLRQHREMLSTRRASGDRRIWLRAARFKRIRFAAPAALAATIALSAGLFALQISGHQQAQTVNAARITRAFAHSVPTISSWRWTLHEQRGDAAEAVQYRAVLNRWQALRSYYGHPYLYDRGHWTAIAWNMQRMAGGVRLPSDWEWAFAILPSLLADKVTSLPAATLQGRAVERFAEIEAVGSNRSVTVTAWVDPTSGLVLRLERVIRQGPRALQRDVIDYRYGEGTT